MPPIRVVPKYRPLVASFSSYLTNPTFHPKPQRFSVPALNQTIDKYLTYTKPLVSPEQWEKTCKVASDYLSSPDVARIQAILEKRSKMEENWLFDWWLGTYLTQRLPVVIHSNPGMRMSTVPFRSNAEWLSFATGIVRGVLAYKKAVESNKLETEFSPSGEAMCMEQFYTFLSNCRIPGSPHDRMLLRRGTMQSTFETNHICVIYKNRVYQMHFRDSVTRESIPEGLLYRQLEHIVATADEKEPGPPVGILTSLPRDEWCRVHKVLHQELRNARILNSLEHSLFVLCLDESAHLPEPSTSSETINGDPYSLDIRETKSSENSLHGCLLNSGNRWFDKSVQFIISRDGSIGVNFEHTAADAGALVPIISKVYEMFKQDVPQHDRLPFFAYPEEMEWSLSSSISHDLQVASSLLLSLIDSLQVQYGRFEAFGSSAIKQHRVSPDAFVQMAMQLAYSRLHPDLPPPPTYETGSLRRFHLGRTDTIRSCSQESVRFTESMKDPDSTPENRVDFLRAALKRHQDFTQELMSGQAFDRHLLGLRVLASSLRKMHPDMPETVECLFQDPTYAASNTYRLSTSQVRSPDDVAVLFGPAVQNGYGVCYNVHRDSVQLTATSFRPSGETLSPAEFVSATFQAMLDMMSLLNDHAA